MSSSVVLFKISNARLYLSKSVALLMKSSVPLHTALSPRMFARPFKSRFVIPLTKLFALVVAQEAMVIQAVAAVVEPGSHLEVALVMEVAAAAAGGEDHLSYLERREVAAMAVETVMAVDTATVGETAMVVVKAASRFPSRNVGTSQDNSAHL